MKRILKALSLGLLLGQGISASAQDLHFSQFYENAMLRNPALAGIFTGDYKIGMDYRSQWGSIVQPYSTFMISGETRVLVNRELADYMSFGMVMTYDKAGSINFTSTQVYPSISFNKSLEDEYHSYLSVGLTGGYLARAVDQTKMTTSNQYINGEFNSTNPTGEIGNYKNLNHWDVGAGVSLNSSLDMDGRFNYYLGASAYHLNNPTEIFYGSQLRVTLPIKWQFSGGFHTSFAESFGLTVHANYSLQDPYKEFIVGGLFTWRSIPVGLPSIFAFHFGAFYRNNDAIIPTVKLDYKDVSIGVSYDATNSTLATRGGQTGATEVSLYLKGMYSHLKNPRDPMFCPRFEDINGYNFR